MVSITCYGGVRRGDNKIIVTDGDTHSAFEFGMSFGRR